MYPLFGHLARGDADGFNAALLEALRAHKKRYGSRSDSHRPEGWVALGPLAMCCLAYDQAMAVTVQSDYLLPYLIERRWHSPSLAG